MRVRQFPLIDEGQLSYVERKTALPSLWPRPSGQPCSQALVLPRGLTLALTR